MNTDFFDLTPATPIKNCQFINNQGNSLLFQVKRDDLVDQQISGNKWRKLKFNIKQIIGSPYRGIASFGGAFSKGLAFEF